VLGLIRASHLGPTAVVTVIAALLARAFELTWPSTLLVTVTVLVGQLSIGWSNDRLDADRDSVSKRADKPTATGHVATASVRLAALIAGVASVPLTLLPGWRPGLCHLLLVGSGWAYNLGLKRVIWSPLPYLVGFGALPAYVSFVADEVPEPWIVIAGGLLGVAAHCANAAPDVFDDRASGVWGMPQRMGQHTSLVVAMVILAATGVLLVAQLDTAVLTVGALVALPVVVGSVLLTAGRLRPVFWLVMVAAVADVTLMVVIA
jgi:4-hydroxybenzoate polyprenyltransferase